MNYETKKKNRLFKAEKKGETISNVVVEFSQSLKLFQLPLKTNVEG